MKLKSLLTLATFVVAGAAQAENLALIISNTSYRTQPDLNNGTTMDRIEAALWDAGFDTISLRNMPFDAAVRRLDLVGQRVAAADRVIFVVNGHVVSSGTSSWVLVPEAEEPNNFNSGAMGLPLAPLFSSAAQRPGASIVAVIEQQRSATVSTGVIPGIVNSNLPQGVTQLKGRARDIANLFSGDLLVPGVSMANALSQNRRVEASGFVPTLSAFLPAGSDVRSTDVEGTIIAEPDPEPELSREEQLAAAESRMALSREDRRQIQRGLAILGFDPRGVDGLFGPGSRRAISAYQADRDLEVSGFVNDAMVAQLFQEADARSAELEEEARLRQEEERTADRNFWRATGQGTSEEGLKAYLRRYPNGIYSELASSRLRAIESSREDSVSRQEQGDWDRAKGRDTVEAYTTYLERYPDGAYQNEATERVDALRAESDAAENARKYLAEERQVAGNSVARRLVESRLAAVGLDPGPVDGTFDAKTRRALQSFQRARGLTPTGYVNQATMVRILIGQ